MNNKLIGAISSEGELVGELDNKGLSIDVTIVGTGEQGKTGKSAYQEWLDLGNIGSEEDFILSLKGQDGYTPEKGVDYFDGIDGKDGRNGVDGKNGKDGVDGNTPVKGVDYFTEADKSEMVSAVLAALPVYEGEVESV